MIITRRAFCEGTAAVALAAAIGAGTSLIALTQPALAQAPSMQDLLQAGPLGDHQLGPDNAPVTIIEYASLTCPHCAHFENTTYPELKKKYIDTGKVRYIFREFVLNPLDAGASMLAHCVDKDKYFPLVETLYQKQDQWVVQKPLPPLLEIAKQAGFTQESFEACLKNQKVLDGIEAVRDRAAEKFGVNSTPTFFINGQIHRGDMTLDELDKLIQPFLKGG